MSGPTKEQSAASGLVLRTDELMVGPRKFVVSIPQDVDEVLSAALEDESAAVGANPYWGIVWPAAHQFAEFLETAEVRPGRSVLELGCGVGLAGLVALAHGYDVTFSDVVPQAVDLARANAVRNGYHPGTGLTFDWAEPPRGSYDLLLGSDLLYDTEAHGPLINTIATMLAEGGEAWIADSGRRNALAFPHAAVASGLITEILDVQGRVISEPGQGRFRVFRVTRGHSVCPTKGRATARL